MSPKLPPAGPTQAPPSIPVRVAAGEVERICDGLCRLDWPHRQWFAACRLPSEAQALSLGRPKARQSCHPRVSRSAVSIALAGLTIDYVRLLDGQPDASLSPPRRLSLRKPRPRLLLVLWARPSHRVKRPRVFGLAWLVPRSTALPS